MSRAERRPDFSIDIDEVLNSNAAIVEKAKSISSENIVSETPFRPVSYHDVVNFTTNVRQTKETEALQESLSKLKDNATVLVMVGENGKLVPRGLEYFPNSRDLVVKAYEAHRLNNETRKQTVRNEVLSHVLSTNPEALAGSLRKKVEAIQTRYSLLQDSFAHFPSSE